MFLNQINCIMIIYLIILMLFKKLYNLSKILIFLFINRFKYLICTKKPIKVIRDKIEAKKEIDISILENKISDIKNKVNDNETKIIKFENDMKQAELAIKQYEEEREYKYKLFEIKTTIIYECAIIVKNIVNIVEKL